jgi:hypothetical protein
MSRFVILSYGRSGSVLLAHNVGRNVGSLPTYAKTSLEPGSAVVHTHLMLPADDLSGYQRVFNLRADPIETVLSFLIAVHCKKYHKFTNQDLPATVPFFVDLEGIEFYCQQLIKWHNYYSEQLTTNDVVVVYEQMIELLTTSVYDQIYPNKSAILLNYSQARLTCEQYKNQMIDSISPFLLHKNTQDIRSYINYSE